MNATRVRHLENSLIHFDQLTCSKQPLDVFIKRYFQSNKDKLSPADRGWISSMIYDIIRWKGLIDYVTPPPLNWPNRLRTFAISDKWKAHTMNPRVPAHIRCSTPLNLFTRIEAAFGTEKAIQICNILNEPPPTFLRVNTLCATRDRVFKYITNKGFNVEKCVNSPYGLMLTGEGRLMDLPEYQSGLIEIQDESSQLVGMKVKARSRMRSAAIRNYHILYPDDPLHKRLKGKMDWVVVDVPCSGTGSLRRNPDIKWNYTDQWLFELVALQRSIFEKALEYLSPTGKIMYSTCSILDEENVQQVKYFCTNHGLCLSESPFHALPQSKGLDGFFTAIFELLYDDSVRNSNRAASSDAKIDHV